MTNLEKINKIAEKEIEIQNKTSEIIERKTRFKMQIAKLMEEFEQSQNKLKKELNTLVQEHDSMLEDTLTVTVKVLFIVTLLELLLAFIDPVAA